MSKKLLCLILSMLLLLVCLVSCKWNPAPDSSENETAWSSKETLETSDTSDTSDISSDQGGNSSNGGDQPNGGDSSDYDGLQLDESGFGMTVSFSDFEKSENK